MFLLDPSARRADQFTVHDSGEAGGYFVLQFRQIASLTVETVSPEMRATLRIDELRVDLNLLPSPPNAAFQNIPYAEIPTDLLHVSRLPLVGEGSGPGDDKAPRDSRQV